MSNMGPVNSDHEDFGDVFDVSNELEVEEPQVPATQPVEVVSKSEGKQSLSAHSSDVDEEDDEEEEENSASSSHDSSPAESSDDEENEEESDEEVKVEVEAKAEADVEKTAEVKGEVKTAAGIDATIPQTVTESPVAAVTVASETAPTQASEPAKRTPRGKVAPKIADLVALFEAKNAENAAKVDDASLLPSSNVKALITQFESESNKDVRKSVKPAAVIGAPVIADAEKATARLSK